MENASASGGGGWGVHGKKGPQNPSASGASLQTQQGGVSGGRRRMEWSGGTARTAINEGSDTCQAGPWHPPFQRESAFHFSDRHAGLTLRTKDKVRKGLPDRSSWDTFLLTWLSCYSKTMRMKFGCPKFKVTSTYSTGEERRGTHVHFNQIKIRDLDSGWVHFAWGKGFFLGEKWWGLSLPKPFSFGVQSYWSISDGLGEKWLHCCALAVWKQPGQHEAPECPGPVQWRLGLMAAHASWLWEPE